MGKKAAIYVRVSTERQTLDQQIMELRNFCERSRYEIFDEYVDEGISALKRNRPEFARLLDDVGRRKVDIVVVYKLDRFSRSLKELVNTIDYFNSSGVDFISYSQREINTTNPTGRLLFNMISSIAEFERDLISERTKLKLAYLKEKGRILGRPKKIKKEDVFPLRKQGFSLSQIGKQLGCNKSTVSRVLSG